MLPSTLFEVEGRNRLEPMEGLRGVAVFLVFLQHYCRQALEFPVSGATLLFAQTFSNYGNRGVELFFVLSGFLIYGILLRKQPHFLTFMARRAQRIYPAFLAALALGIAVDFLRPEHKIPHGAGPAILYIAENLAFLPGLFPIAALFTVNWTLSYEWWFYTSCAALFSAFHVGALRQRWRVAGILAVGLLVIALAAAGAPAVPIRGLSFLAGMLLVEAGTARLRPVAPGLAIAAVLGAFLVCVWWKPPEWVTAPLLAASNFALCSATLHSRNALSRLLSLAPLRWLGNISYSFYLLHGTFTVAAVRLVLGRGGPDWVFWAAMPAVFLLAFAVSAVLFLTIEKPYSLGRVNRATAASAKTLV